MTTFELLTNLALIFMNHTRDTLITLTPPYESREQEVAGICNAAYGAVICVLT